MQTRTLLFTFILLAAAMPARPDAAPNAPLTADEIRAEFLGTRMSGVQLGTRQPFIECIEPDGRSIFQTGDYVSEGVMEVTPDAQACFTYASGTYCYRVQRAPTGYMIHSVGASATFHARNVERGVKRCTADDLIG
ncbi:MAG: hypothetical protein ACK4MQ_08930 [Hyphomonas sp.]